MRVFLANIRGRCPEPAGNGTRKRTRRGIAEPVADIGNRKIAFHEELEAGILANGVLYLVEISPKLGKPSLKTAFRQVEIGAISLSESSASDSRTCM